MGLWGLGEQRSRNAGKQTCKERGIGFSVGRETGWNVPRVLRGHGGCGPWDWRGDFQELEEEAQEVGVDSRDWGLYSLGREGGFQPMGEGGPQEQAGRPRELQGGPHLLVGGPLDPESWRGAATAGSGAPRV